MPIVERAIGGAGTGKTRLILDRLSAAKRELGLSVSEIGFATFTRAGRAEISSRAADAWSVDVEALEWFRTAHSIAYRQCGIEDGQLITGKDGDDWMSLALGGRVNTRIDARGERTYVAGVDDSIPIALRSWELARSTMTPLSRVLEAMAKSGEQCPPPSEIASIVEKYERAKKVDGRCDYTDMIARFAGVRFTIHGPEETDPAGDCPENLRILAIDEAQDSSALVDRVCKRLAYGGKVDRVWLCGDPYQSIHGFAGGDYRLFLGWDAVESVMPQSYRCPDSVLKLGERCLRRMMSGYRDRGILPASHEGSVRAASTIGEALSRITPESSCLILGRCGYSLEPYEEALSAAKVPYRWIDRGHSEATVDGFKALWAIQNGEVATGNGWGNAVAMLAVNSEEHGQLLTRGEKAAWQKGQRSDFDLILPTDEDLALVGVQPALAGLIRKGRWHLAVEPKIRERAEQWLRTATQHGPEIASNPPIKLSTIHGAKGLEAENVILSSVTSPRIERSRMNTQESHDEECRIEYVAVTRARRNFTFVNDGIKHRMELPI
jgi:superfamily I DNA/RNA helicase